MNKHLIWVKAKCNNYFNFINKLQYINVKVYEIKYIENYVYLEINEEEFEKLKKYLVSYKFKKDSDLGIYSIFNKMKENRIFLITLFVGIILYLVLTNMIVKINIVHENKEIRELLEEELKDHGVKILTFKKSYEELDKVKKDILDKYPDKLDWIEFETDGMVYNVRVEERIITDTSIDDKTCDLVAKKNGTISHIKLYAGETVVDLNDYVREGDILISGNTVYNENITRSICASGEVYANVWYTVNVSIPFDYAEYEKTGKKKYNIVWEKDTVKRQIFKNRFDSFESKYNTILKVFDFSLYLESEYETEKFAKKYSENEALEMGLQKAEESIKKKIGVKDTIIDKKVLKKQINDSKMDIEIFVIVEELISEEKITVVEEEKQGVE